MPSPKSFSSLLVKPSSKSSQSLLVEPCTKLSQSLLKMHSSKSSQSSLVKISFKSFQSLLDKPSFKSSQSSLVKPSSKSSSSLHPTFIFVFQHQVSLFSTKLFTIASTQLQVHPASLSLLLYQSHPVPEPHLCGLPSAPQQSLPEASLGQWIPQFHLKPSNPRFHIAPPTHQIHLGSTIHLLHYGLSSLRLRWAPSSLWLHLDPSSTSESSAAPQPCTPLPGLPLPSNSTIVLILTISALVCQDHISTSASATCGLAVALQTSGVDLGLRLHLGLHFHQLHLSLWSPWFCLASPTRLHHGTSLHWFHCGPSSGFGSESSSCSSCLHSCSSHHNVTVMSCLFSLSCSV